MATTTTNSAGQTRITLNGVSIDLVPIGDRPNFWLQRASDGQNLQAIGADADARTRATQMLTNNEVTT